MAREPISLIDTSMPSQGMPVEDFEDDEIEVEEVESEDPLEIIEEEDGSVLFNFEDAIAEEIQAEPDANLAEVLDERVLMQVAMELIGYYEDDKGGRQDWEDAYTEGLDLLGIKYEQ